MINGRGHQRIDRNPARDEPRVNVRADKRLLAQPPVALVQVGQTVHDGAQLIRVVFQQTNRFVAAGQVETVHCQHVDTIEVVVQRLMEKRGGKRVLCLMVFGRRLHVFA